MEGSIDSKHGSQYIGVPQYTDNLSNSFLKSKLNKTEVNGVQTCQVERGGVSAMLVPAVDVLRSQEFLDSVQVTLLGSIKKGSLSPEQVNQITILVLDYLQRCQVVLVLTIWVSTIL